MNFLPENYASDDYSGDESREIRDLSLNSVSYANKILGTNSIRASLSSLEGGHMSATFLIKSEESSLVLKLYPYDRLAFGEKLLFDRWDNIEIPTPKIQKFDFTKSNVPFSYMLMDYIPHNSVSFVDLSIEKKYAVLVKMAKYLKVAHRIRLDEFGWVNFHTDGKGDKTWTDTINNILAGRGIFLVNHGLLNKNGLLSLKSIIVRKIPTVSKSSLLHGDCSIGNILLRDDDVAAFIDPDPIGGDGLYDPAYLSSSLVGISSENYDDLLINVYLGRSPTQDDWDKWNIYKILSLIRQISASVKKNSQDSSNKMKLTRLYELIGLSK